LFAASPFGGPIGESTWWSTLTVFLAYTRNTKNAQVITVDREDGQFIHICSANGKQICKFDVIFIYTAINTTIVESKSERRVVVYQLDRR